MYRNINPGSLGIVCRQNELIELALTYKFSGIDLDMDSFARQVEMRGFDHAARFIRSANIKIGGFELPLQWHTDTEDFDSELKKLKPVCEAARGLKATGCITTVLPYNDDRRYHENFEFHRQRLAQIADFLGEFGIRLGLHFQAAAYHRKGHSEPFITSPDSLVTLMKTIVAKNVGICVDIWNWHVSGGKVEQIRDLPVEKIVAVRVADVPRDVPLDKLTDEDRLLPGTTGIVPCAAAIEILSEKGYTGPVTPYCHASRFLNMPRNRVAQDATKALDRIFGLSAQIVEEPPFDNQETIDDAVAVIAAAAAS